MKILIFGDIHGNLVALEKLMSIFKNEVDLLICHGDVVNYGPWSNECVELLDSINCECVLGNHEEAYLDGKYEGKPLVRQFFNKTYPHFKRFDLIKKYKNYLNIEDIHVQHTINNTYYYPDTDISSLNLEKNTVIGHSHYPFIKKNNNSHYYLINTGSVGQNRQNLNVINCALIDTHHNNVQIKSINYNSQILINEMIEKKYPKICIEYYLSKM